MEISNKVYEMEKLVNKGEEWEVKCGRCLPCGKVCPIPIGTHVPQWEEPKDYTHLFPDNVAAFIASEKNKNR